MVRCRMLSSINLSSLAIWNQWTCCGGLALMIGARRQTYFHRGLQFLRQHRKCRRRRRPRMLLRRKPINCALARRRNQSDNTTSRTMSIPEQPARQLPARRNQLRPINRINKRVSNPVTLPLSTRHPPVIQSRKPRCVLPILLFECNRRAVSAIRKTPQARLPSARWIPTRCLAPNRNPMRYAQAHQPPSNTQMHGQTS